MRSRSQVQRRQARGSASSALLWKPSARLRVRRRASSWGSRRRGPIRGEFDLGGGASMEASARSRRPPPSADTVPTRDAADSEAAACARRRQRNKRDSTRRRSLGLNPGAVDTKRSPTAREGTFCGSMLDSASGAGTDRSPGLNPEAGQNPRRRPGVQAAEFNPRSPRWSPRRSTDLESRPELLTSRMDAEHTREVRV